MNSRIFHSSEQHDAVVHICGQLSCGARCFIHNVCTKVSRGIGIISRLKYIFSHYILISLYYSLVYPYLYYCCIIWGSAYSNVLNTIEVLQNRVARVITSAPYRSSARPILKQLNLLHLPDIYIFQVLTFMYKVRFNILPQPCLSYFTLNKTSNSVIPAILNYFHIEPTLNKNNKYCRSKTMDNHPN
jgi:hypothetical protein